MNYSMSMAALVLFWCLLVTAASGYSPLRFSSWNSNAALAPHSGFVQILLDQEWLDIGSSSWTTKESAVVCRQLGYIESVGILDERYFCRSTSTTTTRRFFTDVECTGEEKALSECHFSVEYTNSTDLPSPSGVICAVPFSLRLGSVSSQAPNLEVLINYNWHLFCGDMFNQSHATVACRQLGYGYGQYTEIDMTTGSFAYVDGYCSGHEFNLMSCGSDLHDPLLLTECNTSISLQCFSPPSRPCQVESSQTSCDSISISWTFSKPVVDSYYIRYRPSNIINSSWIQLKELNTNMSTTAIATISNIDLLTSYEVTLHGSNEYGNGPLSDPIIVSLELPSFPSPASLQVISVSAAEGVNISWEFQELSCSLLCLIGFDVRLTTRDNLVTHTYNISQLTSSSHLHYMTMISGLQGMATYYLEVRAFGKLAVNKQCIETSEVMNGIYSEIVEVTTPYSDNPGIFDLVLFNNPYILLSVFIVACTLVVVLLIVIIVCGCCISFRQCCRRKPKRIYQRRISYSDDNIYAAGDLTEQSYVPMSSSSVPNSLRINRRVSTTPSITNGPRSLWIDFPQPPPTTTFETPEHIVHSNNDNTSHQTDGKSDSEDDNPYDEIAKVQADHHNNQKRDSIGNTSGEDEDEENVYDEIHGGKGEEKDSITSLKQDVEVDMSNLPEAHRLSQINYSQDSADGQVLSPTLPPPMEFAALPPVPKQSVEHNERANRLKGKGLSISMCNIPLPPLPTNSNTSRTINRNVSEGHWNTSNDDQRLKSRNRRQTVNTDTREKHRGHQRGRRMSIDNTRVRSFDKQEDTEQRMRTVNTPRQATSFEQQEDDTECPYYSVPPRDILMDMRQLSRDQEREKSSSPEYEILLHPQSSAALVAAATKVVKSRPSRPPPPVPVIKRNPPTPLALMTQVSQEMRKD